MVTTQLFRPDHDGHFIDPATGRRFSPSDSQGTSASGWSQSTIAAIDGDKTIVTVALFADATALHLRDPVPQLNGLSYALPTGGGQAGDLWIDPQRLATLQSDAAHGLLVTPSPWTAPDGKPHDALRILTTAPDSVSENLYDRQTGLLLHFFQSTRTCPPHLAGNVAPDAHTCYVFWGDFLSVRTATIPWSADPMPDALRTLDALHYRGVVTFPQGMPTAQPQPFRFDVVVKDRGPRWIKAEDSMLQTGMLSPTHADFYYGQSQFAGLWIAPAALGKLGPGQTLDEDPVTRLKTTVARITDKSVIITRSNASAEQLYEYDLTTGLLTASSFYDAISKQRWAMTLAH
jgi:hypothetical protein